MSKTLDLAEFEQRVIEKLMAARQVDWPLPDNLFDTSDWIDTIDAASWGIGEPVFQFPRERWIVYPTKRLVILMLCDRMLDLADELTDEHWSQLFFLLSFGGKERIS